MYGKSKQLKIKNHKKKFFPLLCLGFSIVTFIEVDESSFKHTHTKTHTHTDRNPWKEFLFREQWKTSGVSHFSFLASLLSFLLCLFECILFLEKHEISVWLIYSCRIIICFMCVLHCVEDNFEVVHELAPIHLSNLWVCVCVVSFHLTQANAFRIVGFCVLFLSAFVRFSLNDLCNNNTTVLVRIPLFCLYPASVQQAILCIFILLQVSGYVWKMNPLVGVPLHNHILLKILVNFCWLVLWIMKKVNENGGRRSTPKK